ncbi:MAG: pilus assembly protein N-terminal domain-containing protein [Alphaproteobacteria bacterium]|nr:pilus assembly protein N-terminal domain-containing protein [Alphaproteobacteria bacterium]
MPNNARAALRLAGLAVFFLLSLRAPALAGAAGNAAPLFLTMDQNSILRLQHDAVSVIVNNPGNVGVALDNPRLLILTPHAAGATSMIVLGRGGQVIFRRDIIVSNLQKKYLRVRRVCDGNGACADVSYSYCPDGCYDVTPIPAAGGGTAPAAPPAEGGGQGQAEVQAPKHATIDGEPAETLIGEQDSCPSGYDKVYVPGITSGNQHYTCRMQ